MTAERLRERFQTLCRTPLLRPGLGKTADRHRAIFAVGREDLSLAKLVEAHWDAVAILQEAGREPAPGARYAVWASELLGRPLILKGSGLSGTKEFCSGAALVHRALVTTGPVLVEVDLRAAPEGIDLDESGWHTEAFRLTRTAAVTFNDCPIVAVVGEGDYWYTRRVGFWQGACGPAAAWAGGAAGLVEYTSRTQRADAHALAHLGAMQANLSAMEVVLAAAGDAFDRDPKADGLIRALEVRHIVEQMCTDVLRRFARALGPAPLVKHADVAQRYGELNLFLRQSHGEQDLESLGRALRASLPPRLEDALGPGVAASNRPVESR